MIGVARGVGEGLRAVQEVWASGLLAWSVGAGAPPWRSLALWAILLAACGLCLMLPRSGAAARRLGGLLALVGFGLLMAELPPLAGRVSQFVFWLLAGVSVISAAAAASARSAVYAAVWFALSLLGVAGLLLFQGAQLLAVATVAVYAGAIVVIFLFVIMLAQPEGREAYDRISWGWFPKPASAAAAAAIVAVVVLTLSHLRDGGLRERAAEALSRSGPRQGPLLREDQVCGATVGSQGGRPLLRLTLRSDAPRGADLPEAELKRRLAGVLSELPGVGRSAGAGVQIDYLDVRQDVLQKAHVAHFGDELFGRHLAAVEAAGALLLAALVGAVAILLQGKQSRTAAGEGDDG